ncbi:MAG: hypothetical protein AB7O24_21045 [Kofleriaceae bacterium]
MKAAALPCLVLVFAASTARAELPMGLKCEPTFKIVGAEIGAVGTYAVQIGMKKEEHRALLDRKKISPVDGCAFANIRPGQTVVVKYAGPEVSETEVQCIDLNNNNAPVTFPKSIYTVRNSRIDTWMLMPFCPDGKSTTGGPCSKANTQSARATEYQDTVLKWKGNNPKTKLHKIDMLFDLPYRNSVPAGAKLFCALVNRDGKVVMAGTAQYPAADGPTADDGAAANDAAASGDEAPVSGPAARREAARAKAAKLKAEQAEPAKP